LVEFDYPLLTGAFSRENPYEYQHERLHGLKVEFMRCIFALKASFKFS